MSSITCWDTQPGILTQHWCHDWCVVLSHLLSTALSHIVSILLSHLVSIVLSYLVSIVQFEKCTELRFYILCERVSEWVSEWENNFLFQKNSFFFTKKSLVTQIVMKLKNLNCDEDQKLQQWWNSKTQILMELKNSNCDEIQKLKLWWNFKLNLWWSSKTQIMIKLKNSSCNHNKNSNCD